MATTTDTKNWRLNVQSTQNQRVGFFGTGITLTVDGQPRATFGFESNEAALDAKAALDKALANCTVVLV